MKGLPYDELTVGADKYPDAAYLTVEKKTVTANLLSPSPTKSILRSRISNGCENGPALPLCHDTTYHNSILCLDGSLASFLLCACDSSLLHISL